MNSPNPSTPPYADPLEWITAYMTIHMLSPPSFCYAYYFWYIVAVLFALFTALHWSPFHSTYLGACWHKWAHRRRTWRPKLRLSLFNRKSTYPISLPSNAQILALAVLAFISIFLCFVGPDYIYDPPPPQQQQPLTRRDYDITPYFQFQPTYTIPKAAWTSGGRTGLYAFALYPLCILFILKSPPFAVFAMPFTARFFYDKLAFFHRWTARLIWFIVALHTVLWSAQLAKDRRVESNTSAYKHAWTYKKFIYGWTAFALLTLLILASSRFIRRHFYETFYGLHVLLVPLTLIMSALHHPPIWGWCWAALGLWFGERLWRGIWWLHINGAFVAPSPDPDATAIDAVEKQRRSSHAYCPPPGYARCELLTGATIRITFVPPGFVSWSPGQSFLIAIPSISKFTSHPFTCASICDEQDPSELGHAMVFYIRMKSGWTNDLWDHVTSLLSRGMNHDPFEDPPNAGSVPADSVLLKMWAEGPHGSAAGTDWKSHSTVVIIAGGVGVSFGAATLEYLCRCMAGRDGRYLGGQSGAAGQKGFLIQRVRFVWLIREFAHIQWCASTLRTCLNLVPGYSLQIDIFITNPVVPRPQSIPPPPSPIMDDDQESTIVDGRTISSPPPRYPPSTPPRFTYEDMSRHRRNSTDSTFDLSYYSDYGEDGGSDYTLDLTNFDGDREVSLYGEDAINYRVSRIGKHRRESTRRSMMVRESLAPPMSPGPRGSVPPVPPLPPMEGLLKPPHPLRQSQQAPPREYSSRIEEVRSEEEGSSSGAGLDRNGSLQSNFTIVSHDKDTVGGGASKSSYSNRRPHKPLPNTPISSPRPLKPASIIPPPLPTSSSRPLTPPLPSPVPSLSSSWESGSSSSQAVIATASNGAQVRIELSRKELQDVSVVSEYARSGKPKLEAVLEDEVRQCQGRILVACCGPSSLDSKVRKAIASQIIPGKVHIDLASEDFSF